MPLGNAANQATGEIVNNQPMRNLARYDGTGAIVAVTAIGKAASENMTATNDKSSKSARNRTDMSCIPNTTKPSG